MKRALNPNFVLAAVVVTLTLGTGAVLAIVLAGGPLDATIARAGLITAMLAPTVAALIAILQGSANQHEIAQARQDVSATKDLVNGHLDKHMQLQADASSATAQAAQATAEAAVKLVDHAQNVVAEHQEIGDSD